MRVALALLLLASACEKKTTRPPRPELIETLRDFADRTCACETDKECVRAIRDEWDTVRADVLDHGLTGADLSAYNAELDRFRLCGDAAGLTIWLRN
ncbi:MAG: hypothetical protein AB7T06_36395 [Kofleriaceae bacterium]